ncbi:MAG: hypothetical protein ACRCYY_21785 [Trueperaceae bacterium]
MRSTFKNSDGVSGQGPEGLVASYLFEDEGMTLRLDYPGVMFGDGQARVLIYNEATQSSRVLLRDGLRPDPALSSEEFQGLDLAATFRMMTGFADKPFTRMNADQFLTKARLAAFDVSEQTDKGITLTQQRTSPFGESKMTVYFDTEVGAVTGVSDETTTSDYVQTTETVISHTVVEGIENSVIPYEATTKSTIEFNRDLPNLELPVADEIVTVAEGEEPVIEVPEGHEIVSDYISAPGQGSVDVSIVESEQTIRYENIVVNPYIADDFFLEEA